MSVGDTSGLQFRERVRTSDLEQVPELVVATGFFNAEEVAIARELVEEHLRKGRASDYWFVLADVGAALAGYACSGPVPATVSSHHLYWIAVAPAWQGRGIGRALLERVESLVLHAGGQRLYAETSTRPQYEATSAFYRRAGFELVATLADYFAPGDGKAIYEKRLTRLPR